MTLYLYIICVYISGQILATSHDLGPQNVAEEGEIPLFQENLGWCNIIPFGQIYMLIYPKNPDMS